MERGPHLAYLDITNTALRHTQLVSGTFTTEIVDNAANVGEYTDIAVAPNGTLHIAYRDASNAQLKEAYRSAHADRRRYRGPARAGATQEALCGKL